MLSLKELSPGWDGICASFVKFSYKLNLSKLICIMNVFISPGVFPDELNIANVVSFFRSEHNMLINNNQLVSILRLFFFFKSLERLIFNTLMSFIIWYNIFNVYVPV